MKFGKLLRVTSSELTEVVHILAFYKQAKKTLKHWPNADAALPGSEAREQEFVQTLLQHVSTFNCKWEEREIACKARFARQQQQVMPPACRQLLLGNMLWRRAATRSNCRITLLTSLDALMFMWPQYAQQAPFAWQALAATACALHTPRTPALPQQHRKCNGEVHPCQSGVGARSVCITALGAQCLGQPLLRSSHFELSGHRPFCTSLHLTYCM